MIEALRHFGRPLLIALWLGGAIFFVAVVAPGAFRVLPTSELAGRVVGHALSALNRGGIMLCVLAFALMWRAAGVRREGRSRWLGVEAVALAVLCLTAAATEFVINPRIADLRSAHDIASLAPGDPTRAEFGMLHGLSVVVFGVGLLAALVALPASLVSVRRSRNKEA